MAFLIGIPVGWLKTIAKYNFLSVTKTSIHFLLGYNQQVYLALPGFKWVLGLLNNFVLSVF